MRSLGEDNSEDDPEEAQENEDEEGPFDEAACSC